jgi:hypothetical protein
MQIMLGTVLQTYTLTSPLTSVPVQPAITLQPSAPLLVRLQNVTRQAESDAAV